MAAVTGCRLVAYVPESKDEQRFPIHFSDIERVGLDDPSDPSVFSLRSSGGVRWKIPVDDEDTVTMATISRYVRTGADVYGRAHETTQLVQGRQRDILTAAKSGDDERVTELYEGLTEQIDRVSEHAEDTPFPDIDTFSDTLRRTGRTLDRTHTIALLALFDARCRDNRLAIESGDFEGAAEDLGTLTDWYATVRTRVEENDIDPLDHFTSGLSPDEVAKTDGGTRRRPSPFEAVDADGAVKIVGDRIREIAGSLLEYGNEEFAAATDAEETDREIDHLETALSMYSTVLYDCWGSSELVPFDRDQLRHRRERTVARLVDVRCSVAEKQTWLGYEALDDEEMTTAIRQFDAALEHLESAHELASEFRAGDPEEIAEQWAQLNDVRPEGVAGVAMRQQ